MPRVQAMPETGHELERFARSRVTALVGPYGSGKTELALALAAMAVQQGSSNVLLADLDVIKPYFRSREAGQRAARIGVRLVAPEGALASADMPIVPHEVRSLIGRHDADVILDVGGDPVGARVLGSLSDVLTASGCDLLLVINRYRPFMDTTERALGLARFIAEAARLPLTGVVANTHLMDETTAEDIRWGLEIAREVCQGLGLPLRLLGVPAALLAEFAGQPGLPPIMAIHRQMMPEFLGGVACAPGGLP